MIELMQNNNNNNNAGKIQRGIYTYPAFQEAFQEEYSDFFRDHIATTTAYWRRKERVYSLWTRIGT